VFSVSARFEGGTPDVQTILVKWFSRFRPPPHSDWLGVPFTSASPFMLSASPFGFGFPAVLSWDSFLSDCLAYQLQIATCRGFGRAQLVFSTASSEHCHERRGLMLHSIRWTGVRSSTQRPCTKNERSLPRLLISGVPPRS
jgi:hypothetical protein